MDYPAEHLADVADQLNGRLLLSPSTEPLLQPNLESANTPATVGQQTTPSTVGDSVDVLFKGSIKMQSPAAGRGGRAGRARLYGTLEGVRAEPAPHDRDTQDQEQYRRQRSTEPVVAAEVKDHATAEQDGDAERRDGNENRSTVGDSGEDETRSAKHFGQPEGLHARV